MPQSATTRLALYRPLSDGSELVNVQQDLNNNWAKIDTAIGAAAVTSTTRPSTPYTGQLIRETDTSRIYVSNGSAPASGSWSEITTPGTAQTFTAAIGLTGASMLTTRSSASSNAYRAQVTGDTNSRFIANADGQLIWGTGATSGDTNLYRGAANQLKTDDDFTAVGNLSAANYQQVMPWTNLTSLGSYATNFSNGAHVPRMQKYNLFGTEYWEFEGTIAVASSALTAGSTITMFTLSVATPTNRVATEREFSTGGSSSGVYPVRLGFMTNGTITGGLPTAAGSGTTIVWLDGVRISNPSA